jgi:Protein of unknown function (DUF1566)
VEISQWTQRKESEDIMTGTNRVVWTACIAALMLSGTPAQALSDADKCEAAKNRMAGKYAFCRQKAEARAIKTGNAPDYAQCDAKLNQKWTSAEIVGGGMCPTNGDELSIQACIAAHTTGVATALNGGTCGGGWLETGQTQCDQGAGTFGACPGSPAAQDGALLTGAARSYTDNGNGTITDNVTGLMWEKLSQDGSIHDWGTPYTWYAAFAKIGTLNGGGGFAGHTDWRLPNVNELQSLTNFGAVAPAVDTAFHTACAPSCTVTTCSCTQSFYYWSSTSYHSTPTAAWFVNFGDGSVVSFSKGNVMAVRAVRAAW